MMCSFSFEEKSYQVSDEAYDAGGDIRLPDGRVLRPQGWAETCPPIPVDLVVITESEGATFEATAV